MSYWEDRMGESLARLSNKSAKRIEKQLRQYYKDTMLRTIEDFEATYNKILLAQEEGKEPTPADLYKLDKYWQTQAQLKKELRKLGDKQIILLSKEFEENFFEIYYSIAIPGGRSFSSIDSFIVQQMISQIWCADGKSWSQRIWNNTDQLAATLNDNLIHCVATGKKPSELKHILMERFNVSFNNADMLVRTELSHIQNQAAQKRYEDAGVEEIEIWADKDERRCEHCGKLHQKRFPIGAPVPIPAHPRCRCSILPVIK